MMAPFICEVIHVHDGDTWTCADGRKIRMAGVDANEMDGSCHTVCAGMPADRARAWLERVTYRQRLVCQPVGVSYRRIVASCTLAGKRLECLAIASRAAVLWPGYWVRYGLEPCT